MAFSLRPSKQVIAADWLAGFMDGSFVSDAHRVGVMCRNLIKVPSCPDTVQVMIRKTIWDFENHPYQDVGARVHAKVAHKSSGTSMRGGGERRGISGRTRV